MSGSGRIWRNESPALAGEVIADDDLDLIIGGKASKSGSGGKKGPKRRVVRRGPTGVLIGRC
jgi:hypothetical protein